MSRFRRLQQQQQMKVFLCLFTLFTCVLHGEDEKPIQLTLFDSNGAVLWSVQGEVGQIIELEQLVVQADQKFTLKAPKGVRVVNIRITGDQPTQFFGSATLDAMFNIVNQEAVLIAGRAKLNFSQQWFEADEKPK